MNESGYPHRRHDRLHRAQPRSLDRHAAVRGMFENANRALLPGMFAADPRAVGICREADALLVPDVALGADQAGNYLLVVDKDNVVQQRTVQTGQLVGTLRVITSGLTPTIVVVVSGNQRAIPGEKVAPQTTTITAEAASPPGKS